MGSTIQPHPSAFGFAWPDHAFDSPLADLVAGDMHDQDELTRKHSDIAWAREDVTSRLRPKWGRPAALPLRRAASLSSLRAHDPRAARRARVRLKSFHQLRKDLLDARFSVKIPQLYLNSTFRDESLTCTSD